MKGQAMRKRRGGFVALASALFLALGITAMFAGTAHASVVAKSAPAVKAAPAETYVGGPWQWSPSNDGYYMNDWGGGYTGYDNMYHGATLNNNIQEISLQNDLNAQLESSQYGGCIGDYGNSSSDARAGFDDCSSTDVPWGADVVVESSASCPNGWVALYDKHWGGYVSGGTTNGAAVYLNSASIACWDRLPYFD